jgi:uncharacterized membrane protein (UPF0127 family)
MDFTAKALSAAIFMTAASTATAGESKFQLHFPQQPDPEASRKAIVESQSGDHPAPQQLSEETITITTKDGLTYTFNVQSAKTEAEWDKGLMYQDHLGENEGMLFTGVYNEEKKMGVWMKDTYVPLDLLYIGADGTVSYTYENAQPCDTDVVYSPDPVVSLLELPAGTLEKLGIKPGDVVHADYFKNKPPKP